MNIYQKLIEVRKAVPFLQKDASGGQYKYNSSSQVIAAVRAKLDEMGLLLITELVSHNLLSETIEFVDKDKPKKTTTYFTEVDLLMTWVNAEKPDEQIKIPWYAQGVDIAGEKGVGKALTYGEKTFMLKQFNIATDQMDVDAFQQRMEKSVGRITSNAISQLKSAWIGAGYNINQLAPRIKQLYNCSINELSEPQVDELLAKIKEKRSEPA
ncbi:ERF family protein [Paenibacillus harenae]|uniref:ERF family protein n=1 Tax=Paenibacillus harenae TaxID=306543 RepID=UPI000491D5CF|nr:ERF family protein [Paenibacillus harenae]